MKYAVSMIVCDILLLFNFALRLPTLAELVVNV